MSTKVSNKFTVDLELNAIKRVLPRGSNHLSPEDVQLSQRGRLIEATAYCIDQKGYAATSVNDLIERAGVSKSSFYQLFKDKEDCYLKSFQRVSTAHIKALQLAYQSEDISAQQGLEQAVYAYICHLVQNKIYASAFFAHVPLTTPKIVMQLNTIKEHYIALLRFWGEGMSALYPMPKLSTEVYRILIEGALNYLRRWIMCGFDASLDDVHRDLCYVFFSGLGLHALAEEKIRLMQH